ncbi:MAG: FAD-dependent oxidoreductase [Nitriliruptoraceae bacterium]|nr:FAD-dependent oxidoreductase [Nitriliruptoraceae bacterium]
MSDTAPRGGSRSVDDGEGIRLVGRQDAATHELRDLFVRNSVPHRELDAESEEGRALLDEVAPGATLPVLVTGDGQVLVAPSLLQVAIALSEPSEPSRDRYDLVVVGGGPAGLAAAVNAASEGLATLVVERRAPGGQAGTSTRIENYVGFPDGVSGAELASRAFNQAVRLGCDTFGPVEVTRLEPSDVPGYRWRLHLDNGAQVVTCTVVLATGVEWNRLPVEGVDDHIGRGVYYGSALAATKYVAGGAVHVVGGANSAGQAAVFLADIAAHVSVLVRADDVGAKMSSYLVQRLEAHPRVDIRTGTEVVGIVADDRLRQVEVLERHSGERRCEDSVGLFTFIGARPHTGWLPDSLARDTGGSILTGQQVERPETHATSLEGVFAVGDVRAGSIKRVASAVGEGASVIPQVHRWLGQPDR